MQNTSPLVTWKDECPFWSSSVTLGCVANGRITQTNTVAGKKSVLPHAAEPGVTLFVAWTGRYSTDLFELPASQAQKLYVEKISRG